MQRTSIKDLSCAAIEVKPMDYDWSEGYGERWELVYPDVSDWSDAECRRWLRDNSNSHASDENGLQETVAQFMQDDPSGFEPVMSYAYPLPEYHGDLGKDQAKLDKACACVLVTIDNEAYLALAGGGMDLSWDICEAYMLLGYLPPVHFCRLPRFGGMKLGAKERWILAGCRRSCQVLKRWIGGRLRDLAQLHRDLTKGD
jgi:hypothetical protein